MELNFNCFRRHHLYMIYFNSIVNNGGKNVKFQFLHIHSMIMLEKYFRCLYRHLKIWVGLLSGCNLLWFKSYLDASLNPKWNNSVSRKKKVHIAKSAPIEFHLSGVVEKYSAATTNALRVW